MSGGLGALLTGLLPEKLCGRFIYRLARSKRRWLKNLLIRQFCRIYGIDLSEAATPSVEAFESFNAFFTRELRADARPIAASPDAVVSPADGRITEFGRIEGETLIQAKDKHYSLSDLLAEQPDLLEQFAGGCFLTIYLAPHNYHRVHAPIAGNTDRARYIPGRRFSVNARTTSRVESLYSRNERVAVWLSSNVGYAVVVMVGALNVASLSTVLTGEIAGGGERLWSAEARVPIGKGEELGRFNLGSTVVLLFPRDAVEWHESLESGQAIEMGQSIGRVLATESG